MSSVLDQEMQFDERVSNGYILQMQKERYEIFKSQDLQNGRFDVTFEVEGKLLHANRYVLTSVSEYMKVSLSDRWSKKDEIIKTESYSYDNFYEFLCFIYSGHCKINKSNVSQMVDMAEFYGVSSFKKFCDKALSSMEITVENIEEMFEIADKYSLPELKNSIRIGVQCLRESLYNEENFRIFKKPFIQRLSSFIRDPDYSTGRGYSSYIKESVFFEAVYKWAENRVMKQKDGNDGDFNLLESIKAELNTILPNIKFGKMSFEFLMDFVLEKGFFLSSIDFVMFFTSYRNWKHYKNLKLDSTYPSVYAFSSADESSDDENPDDSNSAEEENFFKTVYKLAEKQAMKKQEMTPEDENFNIAECIRSDLIELIHFAKFSDMKQSFLKNFIVANAIISKEQFNCVYDTRVQVKNNGKFIYGSFKDNLGIRDAIQSRLCTIKECSIYGTQGFSDKKLQFPIPKIQSTVMKMVGVEWYLCLDKDGILSFKHHTAVKLNDYLLAEMKSKTEFNLTPDAKTHVKAFFNEVPDL